MSAPKKRRPRTIPGKAVRVVARTPATREQEQEKKRRGRPTFEFDQALFDEMMELIAATDTPITDICGTNGFPSWSVFHRWVNLTEELKTAYTHARTCRAERYFQEIMPIADSVANETESAIVQAARLRVDTRKWALSKVLPHLYGERLQVDQNSKVLVTDERTSLRDQILETVDTGAGKRTNGATH